MRSHALFAVLALTKVKKAVKVATPLLMDMLDEVAK
jgi:hypothetical protein